MIGFADPCSKARSETVGAALFARTPACANATVAIPVKKVPNHSCTAFDLRRMHASHKMVIVIATMRRVLVVGNTPRHSKD